MSTDADESNEGPNKPEAEEDEEPKPQRLSHRHTRCRSTLQMSRAPQRHGGASFAVTSLGSWAAPHPAIHTSQPKYSAVTPNVSMSPCARMLAHKFRPATMYADPRIAPAMPESTIPAGPL